MAWFGNVRTWQPHYPYTPLGNPTILPGLPWFPLRTEITQQPPLHLSVGAATHTYSRKYPKLNPALAEDTTLIRFDTKLRPSRSIIPKTYQSTRIEYAMAKPTRHMRLISKSFPWSIDIKSNANITCDDVWRALWNGLQCNLTGSEWRMLVLQDGMHERITAAMKKRVENDPKAERNPKRIDTLGDTTVFRGLEKDPGFEKLVSLPFSKPCPETWVVRLRN